ncbi:MAG: GTPase HflX [Treponema sp.]|nr:GTPase HflX [Treponema sp.]
MIDLAEEERAPSALLVGMPGSDLAELKGLVTTLGMTVARSFPLSRLEVSPAYGMGHGKAEEIAALAESLAADVIIFDFEIDPRKQRNWEKLSHRPVFDRQEVILRIFAQRARTREAVLQVKLAQLEYSLPRLAHMYGDMARQRGGNYGSKGSGETQLEMDRRSVREKIYQLRRELSQVVQDRNVQRARRDRIPLPSCALVGYTNAGKSSLLNALTGSDVFVEDKLFATLDPTTRRLSLKNGGSLLLTDTVGFISNLPHSLVNAFKSTLEEAARADVLVIVLDSSDRAAESQYKTVMSVLEEIGADRIPRIIVLNKIDRASPDTLHAVTPPSEDARAADAAFTLHKMKALFGDAVSVSAKTREGFDVLIERISMALLGAEAEYILPVEKAGLLSELRKTGSLIQEYWLEDGIHIKARVGRGTRLEALLSQHCTSGEACVSMNHASFD